MVLLWNGIKLKVSSINYKLMKRAVPPFSIKPDHSPRCIWNSWSNGRQGRAEALADKTWRPHENLFRTPQAYRQHQVGWGDLRGSGDTRERGWPSVNVIKNFLSPSTTKKTRDNGMTRRCMFALYLYVCTTISMKKGFIALTPGRTCRRRRTLRPRRVPRSKTRRPASFPPPSFPACLPGIRWGSWSARWRRWCSRRWPPSRRYERRCIFEWDREKPKSFFEVLHRFFLNAMAPSNILVFRGEQGSIQFNSRRVGTVKLFTTLFPGFERKVLVQNPYIRTVPNSITRVVEYMKNFMPNFPLFGLLLNTWFPTTNRQC